MNVNPSQTSHRRTHISPNIKKFNPLVAAPGEKHPDELLLADGRRSDGRRDGRGVILNDMLSIFHNSKF